MQGGTRLSIQWFESNPLPQSVLLFLSLDKHLTSVSNGQPLGPDGRKAGKARRQAIAKKAALAPRSVAFTDGQGNPMLYIPQKEKPHHLK